MALLLILGAVLYYLVYENDYTPVQLQTSKEAIKIKIQNFLSMVSVEGLKAEEYGMD